MNEVSVKQQKPRRLTISRKYFRSTWKESKVPKIIVAGEYLRQAGFKIGGAVNVIVEHNKITILNL